MIGQPWYCFPSDILFHFILSPNITSAMVVCQFVCIRAICMYEWEFHHCFISHYLKPITFDTYDLLFVFKIPNNLLFLLESRIVLWWNLMSLHLFITYLWLQDVNNNPSPKHSRLCWKKFWQYIKHSNESFYRKILKARKQTLRFDNIQLSISYFSDAFQEWRLNSWLLEIHIWILNFVWS